MEVKIVVALIAANAAIAVAFISLVATIINSRHSAKVLRDTEQMRQAFTRDIEEMKQAFDRITVARAIRDDELQRALESLKHVLRATQKVKDVLQVILSAIASSLDSESAIADISDSRKELFSIYEGELAHLDDLEKDAVHQAKNTSLAIEEFLSHFLSSKEHASDLTEEEREQLFQLRDNLTEMQQIIRDSRLERMLQRTFFPLEAG